DLSIAFTNKGGVIRELELINYKTYYKKPLKLIDPTSNSFKLKTRYNGQEIDLNSLFYTVSQTKNGDTTVVTFTRSLSETTQLVQQYSIPPAGFKIGYSLKLTGGANNFSEQLTLDWQNVLRPFEKNLTDSRNNTTITYYYNNDFDELTQRSTSTEREVFSGNLKWVSIKQKFFLASIISEKEIGRASCSERVCIVAA